MSALWCYYCNIILKELCPFYDDSALIHAMQDYLDAKHPTLCVDSDDDDENSNDSSSNDGYHVEKTTLTITGWKRNLILLNHLNATSTGLNGQG